MIYSQFGEAFQDSMDCVFSIDKSVLAEEAREAIRNGRAFGDGGAREIAAAVSCGYCRLYGGEPVQFPPEWGLAAANRLQVLIEESSADAENLPAAWDAVMPDEGEDLVAALLFARMDAWAAFEALDAAVEAGGDEALRERVEACQDTLANFDHVLWDRRGLLSTIVETQLLPNWRLSLAAGVPMPWWLDGRLEEEAIAVDLEIAKLRFEVFGPRPKRG